MDVIQQAIEKGLHISENEKLNAQTWQAFMENAVDKKIFLFGTGACADYFFKNYGDIRLEGIIDNDTKKQGFCADDFIGEARESLYGKTKISSIEILKKYNANDILVLITSTNYYREMIGELEDIGIKNYFLLIVMEVNRRKQIDYISKNEMMIDPEFYACEYSKYKVEQNKIVFYSFGTYSDHGKYITEALLNMRVDLDIVWVVANMETGLPQGVRKVYLGNWKRYIYEMETARIWVYNMPVPSYIIKRQEQIYIQTKHWASITLKKFYLDSKIITTVPENVLNWKQDSKKIDYIITGSDFDTQSSRRGFDFHKEVLQIGSPRSDAMFRGKEKKETVYSYYGLDIEKQMLLYAPTYRYDSNRCVNEKPIQKTKNIELDYEGVKNAIKRRFGGEWYIALRLPPGQEKEVKKLNLPEYVIDLSVYEDGEEVAAACDIMISDYSSIMFEPAFVKKPVFLFAMDKKEYIDKQYDLLIDYDMLPFPAAGSNMELIKNIENFEQDNYEKNLNDFMSSYGVCEDGHASERAADIISKLINTTT